MLLLLFTLSCPVPKIVNYTGTWNEMDKATYSRAQTRCKYYFPNSPCLIELRKIEERRYQAVCGIKR